MVSDRTLLLSTDEELVKDLAHWEQWIVGERDCRVAPYYFAEMRQLNRELDRRDRERMRRRATAV